MKPRLILNPHLWAKTLAVLAMHVMTARYVLGGLTFSVHNAPVVITPWTGTDYAVACGMWLAYLVADKVVTPESLRADSLPRKDVSG